ncbi:uroplakin-3b-like protein 1 isoform X2 [Oenanthe melanoleuca]|uniref:uroplakin-3b-like protein 1 isoform X2 n=1 Tax=Oenanthe melanoleuca TaxID=2939378 RepID=UPI0024C1AD6D|nr:uroplakin-3b-like protein 1 isoform X2 [Oenanthe melanoleuca]
MVTTGGSRGDAEPQKPHSRPRHTGARTMLPLLLLLLPAAHGIAQLGYTPALTTEPPLGGKKTASTFVLDQPRCVFNDYGNADIWLVVALDGATSSFNNTDRPGSPEIAFQSFPDPARAYMTLNATLANYPCPKPAGDITVLRVGSETSCAQDDTRPTCNGPLPGPGPYRVKFLALEGSVPVAETFWSDPIRLTEAESPNTISTTGSGHSAGMIAITTILSILFAVLLAGLVAMLIFWRRHAKGSITLTPQPGHSALTGCPCATREGC